MKVILTTNIKKLGKVGDQVNVANGFARNYLFPNKMALRNTESNKIHFEKIKDDINDKENNKRQKGKDLIEEIKKLDIKFTKEADEKDQLYGSISKKEIINFFNDKNIKLMSDDIKILTPIRTLGQHTIEVNPYEEITSEIIISVNKN